MKTTRSKTGVVNFDDPVFFDLETSGTDFNKHQIIQIGAVRPSTGETFERRLFFDLSQASEEALRVNHYDPAIWSREATSQRQGLKEFADWLEPMRTLERESRQGNSYRVVTGAGFRVDRFDLPFLAHHFNAHRIFCPFDYRVLDVMQLALWILPGLHDYSLSALTEHCQIISNTKEHDALEDCRSTIRLAAHLLGEIYSADSLPQWVKKTT